MKKLFLFLLILLSSGIYAENEPYPISPVPLRQLVAKSSYIIIGHVLKIEDQKDNGAMATIAVLECIQGTIRHDTIRIYFNPNMICPAPDLYYEDTYVLSFIKHEEKSKKENVYRSVALNYGARTLSLKDIAVYKQRIRDFQGVNEIANDKKRFAETVECLVKCAEHPATRWDGTFELSPESDFMSVYSQKGGEAYGHALTTEQKFRLKTALLQTKDPDYTEFGLIDLVYGGNETEIEDFMIRKLKTLASNQYWYAGDYMKRLKHRNISPSMDELLARQDKLEFSYKEEEAKKEIIEEFLLLIGG